MQKAESKGSMYIKKKLAEPTDFGVTGQLCNVYGGWGGGLPILPPTNDVEEKDKACYISIFHREIWQQLSLLSLLTTHEHLAEVSVWGEPIE